MATYSAILEVEAHANGGRHDVDRYLEAINDLRKSSIRTHKVLDVVTQPNEQPTSVKHFGYDYRCGAKCNHDLAAYGINRYFGITLVIQGYANPEAAHFLFGRYQVNPHAQLDICGTTNEYTGERSELQEVA